MEKLVDIVHFLHLEIHAAFGNSGNAFGTSSSLFIMIRGSLLSAYIVIDIQIKFFSCVNCSFSFKCKQQFVSTL